MIVINGIRRARRTRARRRVDKQADDLRAALDRLGYDWWPIPLGVRVALRKHDAAQCGWFINLQAWVLIAWLFLSFEAVSFWQEELLRGRVTLVFLAVGMVLTVIAGQTMDSARATRRNRLAWLCAYVIERCAEAHRRGGDRRREALVEVSMALRSLGGEVLAAYRRCGSVRSFSPPNADLRRHAGQVVAKLRTAEAGLHGDCPQHALEEVAGLVATIAEQYTRSKVATLLPVGSVADFEPVRDREPILVGVTVVTIAGGAVAVSLLDLPDVASGAVIVAVAVLMLLVLFGRRWHRYLPIADMFKPGP
ncbi:hypothetical protein [Streptomyces botrytidirepellens]|uniref:hypothetical protein n=1 Tax=Streptomyces botrytidirepellens TaxID=2486417 RepID=UPI001FE6D89C|nr:hypothetical protein [Streptomyces botrytidirepellens]